MTTTLKLTEIKHTLVMPAFNEEEKIERSINKVVSFLRNNLDEFEVIITENGSTDNTFIRAIQVAEKNTCVKVIHIEESGRGRALPPPTLSLLIGGCQAKTQMNSLASRVLCFFQRVLSGPRIITSGTITTPCGSWRKTCILAT